MRYVKEILWQTEPDKEGKLHAINVANPGSNAYNPAFDITPARLITAFITEKVIINPYELFDVGDG